MLMKTILFGIIISLLISVSVHSQGFWEWTDPLPLTDSLSDNTNPDLYLSGGYGGDELIMVWEKSFDSTSIAIYFDNILDSNAAIEVLYDSLTKYTNPKIIDASTAQFPDYKFHILYETNQNGNLDIYYITYLIDGSFTVPTALINTNFDEIKFNVGRESFWWDSYAYNRNSVAFIRNDSLLVINQMQDGGVVFWGSEIFIDSPVNDRPLILGSGYASTINYLKSDSIEKHIFLTWSDQYGNWNEPEIFYDSTNCRNINNILHYNELIWSTYIDTSWRIMHDNWYTGYFIYNISNSTPFDPATVGIAYGVKSTYIDGWVATPFPENYINEIYMNEWPGGDDFSNFSNSGTENRNPNTFEGEHYGGSYYCWYDYLVWESYRNGHWQIWTSKVIQCAGFIGEENVTESFLSIHPNPFTHETTLEFTLDTRSDVTIEIYDNRGMHISTIANRIYDQGEHQLRWDGEGLVAGIYIIKMIVGDMVYTSKVVKAD